MPKHRGIVSRSRPSFEYLEERALLSGGLSGSPGTEEVPAPPLSPIPSGSQLPASPGSGGAQGSQIVSFVILGTAKLQSGPTEQASAGPTSLDTPAATTEPETLGPVSPSVEAAGGAIVTVSAGHEIGPETGGTSNNGPSGLALTSPPAQVLSLPDPDSVSARLLSEQNAPVGGSQRAVNGAGRGSLTLSDQHGTAITGRGGLVATTDVSTALTDAQADDWPRPSSAELIASALPFDRAALDRAIDRFFQHFEDLSAGELVGKGPSQLLLYSVALASTFAALEVVHRRWWLMTTGKHLRVRHPLAISDHIGFPELPESWSSRIS
jgi:hypothetical protein